MIKICTFYWKDPNAKHHGTYEFTPKHVNRLARGLRKNLTIPHEVVCITDDPTDIDVSNIRIIPLWNEFRDLGRCFVRLGLYSSEMRKIIGGRIANIDLDCAILGNVDHIFGRTEPFIGYTDTKNPLAYSGALYMMDAGCKEQVYSSFKRLYNMIPIAPGEDKRKFFLSNWNKFSKHVGSDQSWQTEILGPGLPKINQDDKTWDFWSIENLPELPTDSRLIFVNGMRRDVSMPEFHKKHKWLDQYWNG